MHWVESLSNCMCFWHAAWQHVTIFSGFSYWGNTWSARIIKPSSHWAFTCSKSTIESLQESEICSKLTIKTPKPHQLTSFYSLFCKLYTHFKTCLVFVLTTLNMQLFAGLLSFFWQNMWEIHREAAMRNCSEN